MSGHSCGSSLVRGVYDHGTVFFSRTGRDSRSSIDAVLPRGRFHLCDPAQLGPAIDRLLGVMPNKVPLKGGHADPRTGLHSFLDVGDELVAELGKLFGREVLLVRIEAREQLGGLVRSRVVDELLQIDPTGSDQRGVEPFEVVRREEQDPLRGGRSDAVEGVEETRKSHVAVETVGERKRA